MLQTHKVDQVSREWVWLRAESRAALFVAYQQAFSPARNLHTDINTTAFWSPLGLANAVKLLFTDDLNKSLYTGEVTVFAPPAALNRSGIGATLDQWFQDVAGAVQA